MKSGVWKTFARECATACALRCAAMIEELSA
jgi:hypothetical protein